MEVAVGAIGGQLTNIDADGATSMMWHAQPFMMKHDPHSGDFGLGLVRVFRQGFALEDAIGSHACSLDANTRVTNGIPLGRQSSYRFTLYIASKHRRILRTFAGIGIVLCGRQDTRVSLLFVRLH